MPRKKKTIGEKMSDKKTKLDTRMIAQYFKEMIKYVEKYGKKLYYYGRVEVFMKYIQLKILIQMNFYYQNLMNILNLLI